MTRFIPLVAVGSVLMAGCVSASKYREQEAETLQYQQKASTLGDELAAAKSANAKLESERDAARAKAAELAQAISDGAAKDIESITAIVRRLDGMIESKRALQKSTASSDDNSPRTPASSSVPAASQGPSTK